MNNKQTFNIFTPKSTGEFRLLDSGHGKRLEQWGKYRLVRPDPQAIWQPHLLGSEWKQADAVFDTSPNSSSMGGLRRTGWKIVNKISQPWIFTYNLPTYNLQLLCRLTPFKHTGVFPEQASNWIWLVQQISNIKKQISNKSEIRNPKQIQNSKFKILNLFAYTGAATCLLSKFGCFVTHVDASKPSIEWAKDNTKLNNLPGDSVRWILDDAVKFVKREVKRGALYDGIIMDPPAFGHSPQGKTWKFAEDLPLLLAECKKILSSNAFVLVNSYATNTSAVALQNLIEDIFGAGYLEAGELGLKQLDGRVLSTGIVVRWSKLGAVD